MNQAILIVEDSPLVSDLLALRLAKNFPNFEVLSTTSVTRGIELIEIFEVEIVLTDLNVADSRGISTAMRIRQATDSPIIIHSDSMRDEKERAEALDLGFEDIFGKGKLDDVLDRMRCLLGAGAAHRTAQIGANEPEAVRRPS